MLHTTQPFGIPEMTTAMTELKPAMQQDIFLLTFRFCISKLESDG